MDSAVIRKILDTSTVDLLGEKAAAALKRRSQARALAPVKPRKPAHAARHPAPVKAVAAQRVERETGVVERPDGLHAVADDGVQEFGPFETYEEALASIDAPVDEPDEEAATDIEALHEAEENIGIANWLDPETGEPAEGRCPPHLDAE